MTVRTNRKIDEQAQPERKEYTAQQAQKTRQPQRSGQTQNNKQTQHSERVRNGQYSPNQCVFFVVLTLLVLIPFLGQRLAHPVQRINSASLKNIYSALTAPAVSVTEASPLAGIIPVLRNAFIQAAGLTERSEWDTFFYRQGVYDSAVAALYAITGEQGYTETLSGLSDDLHGGSLSTEVFAHISKETLRNVALPVVHSAQTPLRLFFFGDSQMRSIAAGMIRALGSDASIVIQDLSVPSSGFLRSDYYNWPQKLESLFAEQKTGKRFDAAVIFLGMNDYQDMWTTDGIILTAGTPEWEEVYRKMVKTHLDTALAFVPRLYWLGLPVVRSASYNEKIDYLNTVHASIAEEYDANALIRISLKSFVERYGKGYIGVIRPEGKTWIPLMQSDGIHYTIEGGEYLMKQFIARLHRDYMFETPH